MCKIVSANGSNGVTIVQNRFLDEYLVDANEHELKVYLYLLRYLYAPGADIAIKSMADALGYTESKIKKALKYWQAEGLVSCTISEDTGEIVKICIEDINAIEGNTQAPVIENKKAKAAKSGKEEKKEEAPRTKVVVPMYSKEQLAAISADEHFKQLIGIVEKRLKKTITPSDINILAEVYEGLGFDDELIDYLYAYCAERNNKTAPAYIEKVAISWAEKGITNIREAEKENGTYESFLGQLKGIFGKVENFGTPELNIIDSWIYIDKYPKELIVEACNRTVIEKKTMRYTGGILKGWKEREIVDLKGVEKDDASHKESEKAKYEKKGSAKASETKKYNQFNDFPQRQYTKEQEIELEKELILKNHSDEKKGSLKDRLAKAGKN